MAPRTSNNQTVSLKPAKRAALLSMLSAHFNPQQTVSASARSVDVAASTPKSGPKRDI